MPAEVDPNKLLTLAIKARVPAIHVRTDELLHVTQILTHLAECSVNTVLSPLDMKTIAPGSVSVTNSDYMSVDLYLALKKAKATLVTVNTKPHPLHLQVPAMVAPIHMVKAELSTAAPEKPISEFLPAVGGLTLKDVFEVCKVTLKRDAALSAKGLTRTRQSYPNKLKGLSQIDTDFDFYDAPHALTKIVDGSLKFFHADAPLNTLAPRGLLFDGPPGTGKTLGAKYVADQLGVPLYRLDVSGLKGKYVGDSEGALNAALAQLDQSAPCVVLIDEVEKLFRKDTTSGDAGVTLGLLGSMLWWLQEHSTRVLTIMTTNNAKALPPELHREGRVSASLVFLGLENAEQAALFTQSLVGVQEKKLGVLTDEERSDVYARVASRVEDELQNGACPHSKVAQYVLDAITDAFVLRHNN